MNTGRTGAPRVNLLGKLRVGESQTVRLPLGLSKERLITIKGVEASCGCMQVLGYPAAADEHAEISLRYMALKEGPVSVRVVVETDLPAQPLIEFAFTGEVVEGDRERAIMTESIAPDLFFHRDVIIPAGLLVTGAEARALSERGAIVVDIRTPAERTAHKLTNALELSLREVRSKPFLMAQPIVLLGSAVLSAQVLEAITALPVGEKGRVYYIDGGLAAWAEAGGAVLPLGSANESTLARVITPSELHASANRNRYLMVDVSGEELAPIYLPEAVRLRTSPDNSVAMSEALARLRKEAPDKILLLVAKDAPTQLRRAASLRDPSVWFLDGGLAAYRAFLAAQTQSLLARHDGRHVVQARQGAVTTRFPRERLNGGCGSCPGRH